MRPLLTATLTLLAASPVFAAPAVGAPEQAALLLRALAYDRNLEAKVRDGIKVIVVFAPRDPSSVADKSEMLAALANARVQAESKPPVVVEHAYASRDGLAAAVRDAHVVYLASGLGADVDAILAVCTQAKLATLGVERAYVDRGVAMGVTLSEGKPKLVINLPSSRAQGMDLDSQLFRVAEVVQGAAPTGGPLDEALASTQPVFVSGPNPAYTPQALDRRVEGLISAKCVITADGNVTDCKIVQSLPFMDSATVRALEKRKYKPATRDGQAVAVEHVFNIRLALPK